MARYGQGQGNARGSLMDYAMHCNQMGARQTFQGQLSNPNSVRPVRGIMTKQRHEMLLSKFLFIK